MRKTLTLFVASIAILLMGAAPITVSKAYVTKSGSVLIMFVGTSQTLPAYPTSVKAQPTVTVNGAPVTLQGPFWASGSHVNPWVAYQLPAPAKPADVVLWSTSDGWVTASQGSAVAESGQADNYSGQLEPGVFGYTGFNDSARTMKLGFNGPANVMETVCLVKNAMLRAGKHWPGAATDGPDGFPATVGATGVTSAQVWVNNLNNGIDPTTGFPAPQGTWTFSADETAPATPMAVNLVAGRFLAQPANPIVIPGRIINGTEYGKRWTWDVTTVKAPWNLGLSLTFATPKKTAGPFTLQNLQLYEPGNALAYRPGLTTNDNIARMLTAAPGITAPVVRCMEALAGMLGASSLVGPGDLTAASEVSYASTFSTFRALPSDWPTKNPTYAGDRLIPIMQARRYDLAVSPNVYTATQYKNCQPTSGGAYPFAFTPASYDWMYSSLLDVNGNLGQPNNVVVIEFLTGDAAGNPINHNLQSGQFIVMPAMPPIPIQNANGAGTAVINGTSPILFVTGLNSFIVLGSSSGVAGSRKMGWVAQPTTINANAVFQVGTNGRALPPEVVANISKATGNGIWVAVNHCMSDAGVRALAQRIYRATAAGTPVYVQWSNEIFIPNAQYGFGIYLASMQGLTQTQAIMQRTAEVQTIFRTMWGDDEASIVCVFQPFTPGAGATRQALQYAATKGFKVDAVAIAPYVNMDTSPTFAMSAAAICANDQRSIANPANGGPGVLMPMDAYQDMTRHHIKYNRTWNGPGSLIDTHVQAIAASGYLPAPKIVGYEGGWSAAIPPGVSKQAKVVRAGLSHDFMYHSSYYDTCTAFAQFCQQPGPTGTQGFDLVCIEGLAGSRQFGGAQATTADGVDGGFINLWATYIWQGQQAGSGLKNKFWAADLGGDGAAHDVDNEAVGAKAYMDWILSAYPGMRKAG